MDEQNLNVGYIITNNNTEKITIGNKTIIVAPFWKEALGFSEYL